jgi:hypothetical protein
MLKRRGIVRSQSVWLAHSRSVLQGKHGRLSNGRAETTSALTVFPVAEQRPFPFYICYNVESETIYFLGLVHERRHPDFLKDRQGDSD